jgi:hypothetical protein
VARHVIVTLHGPLSAAADPAAARIEVDALMGSKRQGWW